jgi:hypothetical protein
MNGGVERIMGWGHSGRGHPVTAEGRSVLAPFHARVRPH